MRLEANDDYAISPLISNYLVKRMSIRDKLKKDKPSINDLTLMERKTLKQFQKINLRKKLDMSFL